MSATPPKSAHKTPSKKWFGILFGSTVKETPQEDVEPSTDSTEPRRSLSKPKNLQQINFGDTYTMEGTVIGSSGFPSPTAAATVSVMTPPLQKLKEITTTTVPKSPWRSLHSATNNVPGMGRSELEPSRGTNRGHDASICTTTNIFPVTHNRRRHTRNKYKTSLSMGIPQNRRNRGNGGFDINVSMVLNNARSVIEPSKQKVQADNNFRNNYFCRQGSQLHRRPNGRLPEQQPENSNGKREIENNDQSTMEVARKKRKVGFTDLSEKRNGSIPIENLVSTPSRKPSKRKATPYKSEAQERNVDCDEEMPGASKSFTIARNLVKAKRPASKTDTKKSCNDDEREESFSSMPDTKDNIIGDYTIWSKSDEREIFGEAITGDIVAPSCFMLKPPVSSLSEIPIYEPTPSLPQFSQKPLAERVDKRVPDEDDDYEAFQDKKRSKAETWKCDECGFENENDESRCLNIVVEKNTKNKKKCDEGRKSKEPLGWGNIFAAEIKEQKERIKCTSCGVYNEKTALNCASCETALTIAEANSNGTSTTASTDPTGNKIEMDGTIGKGGFTFGGAASGSNNTGVITSTGFNFGGKSTAASAPLLSSPTTTSAETFSFKLDTTTAPLLTATTTTAGGFQFGAAATVPASTVPVPVLNFGFPSTAKSTAAPATVAQSSLTNSNEDKPSMKVEGNGAPLLFGNFAAPSSSSLKPNETPKTAAPSTTPFKFGENKKSTTAVSAPTFHFGQSNESKVPTTKPATERQNIVAENKNFFSVTKDTTTKTTDSEHSARLFSTASNADSTAITSNIPAVTSGFDNSVPPLGSVITKENDDGSSKKKRRGRDDTTAISSFGTTASSASVSVSSGMFGNNTSTVPSFSGGAATSVTASKPFVFGNSSTESSKQDINSSSAAPVLAYVPTAFGNTSNSNNTIQASDLLFGGNAPSGSAGLSDTNHFGSVGSAPVPVPDTTFGSNVVANTAGPFGSTPAAPASVSLIPTPFGSTPAPGPTFGSAAPTQATFGSTPGPAPNSNFGSTPFVGTTTPAQSLTTFGSTPAPAQQSFGNSTPVPAQQPFGNGFGTPAPTAPAQPFGTGNASSFNTTTTFGTAQPGGVSAPVPFGAQNPATTGGFGGHGATQNSTPGGFGQHGQAGGFGSATSNVQTGNFSLGTGGASRGRVPGRRRIKARRPK
mmetsp:Transcript_56926/g.61705  ORF Transcript_56926/g.61705 Transcript_56926/m.61705 type:complete len:1174 (-) Transcript_56926:191-3712(-)